jgi:transposase
VEEELGQGWAAEMKALLLRGKRLAERAAAAGRKVAPRALARFLEDYEAAVARGFEENPEPARKPGQRGRLPRGKALNLVERFAAYQEEVLAFLFSGAPFENNQAERDLRMIKTRQKVSGCFRTLEWARGFARVRSVINTAKKRGLAVYGILQTLFQDPEQAKEILLGT